MQPNESELKLILLIRNLPKKGRVEIIKTEKGGIIVWKTEKVDLSHKFIDKYAEELI